MSDNGAEYVPEDGLGSESVLKQLTWGLLLTSCVVRVAHGVIDRNPVFLPMWVVIGGVAAFMLARERYGGAPVVES
jgi:hypothetical protein